MSNADRIEELRSKYEENPRRYFAPLANEFRKAGDLAQAIAICREHLPRQPGHMSGYIVFGQTLFEANNLDEARSVFEQALTLDPENLIALKHLGDIARMNGENSVARRWYARVLDADPRNDDIASQLASLGAPTPALSQPAIAEQVEATSFAPPAADADNALGVFATFDPSALLDLPANLTGESQTASEDVAAGHAAFWSPPSAAPRPPVHHEPLDLDFPDEDEVAASADATDLAEAFEEGLLAPEWPDTSELVARLETPVRSMTPMSAPATPDEIAAFGRERTDEFAVVQPERVPADELVAAFLPVDTHGSSVSPAVEAQEPPVEDAPTADEPTALESASSVASEVGPAATWEEPVEVIGEQKALTDEQAEVPEVPEVHEAPVEIFADDFVREGAMPWDTVAPAEQPVPEERQDTPVAEAVPAASDFEDSIATGFDEPIASDFEDSIASDSKAPIASGVNDTIASDFDAWTETQLQAAPSEAAVDAEFPEESFADVSDESASERAWLDGAAAIGEASDVLLPEPDEHELEPGTVDATTTEFEVVPDADDQTETFSETVADDSERPESDAEPVVAASALLDTPTGASSAPFVTETMAELLVAQGFLSRAIEVYDELVRRRPHDPVLAARLAELQRTQSPSESDISDTHAPASDNVSGAHQAYAAPQHVTPVATARVLTPHARTPLSGFAQTTPFSTHSVSGSAPTLANLSERHQGDRAEAFRTARERLAELSRRRVARRTPSHATAVSDEPNDGLSSLFGTTTPASTDELAARALADAFGPVQDSGESLFEPAATPTPVLPLRALTPRSNAAVGGALSAQSTSRTGTPEYSFDRFFPDPAIAGNALHSGTSTPASQTVNEDLAQFSAWLKGLNNA